MDTGTEETLFGRTCSPSVSDVKSRVAEIQPVRNGDLNRCSLESSKSKSNDAELEDDFKVASDLSFLKDTSLTSSPSENFKSSYAKSLADSYRRASLPVVVSAPKGQFYFNNEEVISLNSSYISQSRCLSLNSNASTAPSLQSCEPVSLPTAINSSQVPQQPPVSMKSCSSTSSDGFSNFLLEDIPVFVPYERIHNFCEQNGGESSKNHASSEAELVTTSDGKKLVMLSGYHELLKRKLSSFSRNGETRGNAPEKEAQGEGLRLECAHLESRVQQLCEVLADRDSTIQRLEEDLLRMRMECQRLMVENRSLKSTVSPTGAQPSAADSTCEAQKLKQHVELLTAQLEKAERSRRTYETATRQLVDFLHTVNTTLSTSNTSLNGPGQSGSSFRNSTMNLQSDASHDLEPPRRHPEAVQRAESVYALPTHSGNRPRVNRSVSTYCVASVTPTKESSPSTGRVVNSEFLVTRAKELIASLKSLTRNESVMKVNVEPKKSASSIISSSGVSLRSFKKEDFSVDGQSSITSTQLQISQEDDASVNGAEAVVQEQTPVKLNDNSQPLSLMVVGETTSNSVEHGYSSLPINGCVSRILNDSEQRLVWV